MAQSEIVESEEQLVETAQNAVSQSNWVVGECASKWTVKYAKGRTDADFGRFVGLSGDQIFQRRRVWETFGDVFQEYPALKWSHFYSALTWDDAAEILQWANENEVTVAEMKAWRRLQRGEEAPDGPDEDDFGNMYPVSQLPTELTAVREPGESDESLAGASVDASASASERDQDQLPATSAARETAGSGDYSPYRTGAMTPAPKEDAATTAVAERPQPSVSQLVKRMTKTIERCAAAMTPEFLEQFHRLPESHRDPLIEAVKDLASKIQVGEARDE